MGGRANEIQKALMKLAVDTKVVKGQLLKLCNDTWLPYIRPSLRVDSVVAANKTIEKGHTEDSSLVTTTLLLGRHALRRSRDFSCLP